MPIDLILDLYHWFGLLDQLVVLALSAVLQDRESDDETALNGKILI